MFYSSRFEQHRPDCAGEIEKEEGESTACSAFYMFCRLTAIAFGLQLCVNADTKQYTTGGLESLYIFSCSVALAVCLGDTSKERCGNMQIRSSWGNEKLGRIDRMEDLTKESNPKEGATNLVLQGMKRRYCQK